MTFVRARNQKEAVRGAVEGKGVVPRDTSDARPRTGSGELMDKDDFLDWLENHLSLDVHK